MTKQHPFKFLDSYNKEDSAIFFGRDREIEELYAKVQTADLTLLYGLAGMGKTSLVQCGLANKLSEVDGLELYLCRNDNLLQSIRSAIDAQAKTSMPPQTALVDALKGLYSDYARPVYLLLDQLEDLFISGGVEEQNDFVEFLNELLKREDLKVKVLLVLREDYVTELDTFEAKIPIIFNNRMRLERMSNATLLELIENIIKKAGLKIADKKVLQQIINHIADEHKQVELSYLQIYLDKLNSLVKDSSEKVVDKNMINKVGSLEDVLGDFLEAQVHQIGEEVEDEEMVWNILKMLVSSEGTRQPIRLEELKANLVNSE